MTSASESAAERLSAHVGVEPVDKVLRESGMVPSEAGVQRWRASLDRPIPDEALAEGRQRLAAARAEAGGAAA